MVRIHLRCSLVHGLRMLSGATPPELLLFLFACFKDRQNGRGQAPLPASKIRRTPLGNSIYINCQEASQYDTVTFGRAYEQYIEKTRAMATLSTGDLDEILRPLLNMNEDAKVSQNHHTTLRPTNQMDRDAAVGRIAGAPIASSDDSSEPSSPSHLISQIAINNTRGTTPVGIFLSVNIYFFKK